MIRVNTGWAEQMLRVNTGWTWHMLPVKANQGPGHLRGQGQVVPAFDIDQRWLPLAQFTNQRQLSQAHVTGSQRRLRPAHVTDQGRRDSKASSARPMFRPAHVLCQGHCVARHIVRSKASSARPVFWVKASGAWRILHVNADWARYILRLKAA